MDANQLAEFMKQQDSRGQDLQRMLSNFNKDSSSRKSEDYLAKKLKALEDLWQVFDANHKVILPQATQLADHKYFKTRFYENMLDIYNNYKSKILLFQQEIQDSSTTKSLFSINKESLQSTSASGSQTTEQSGNNVKGNDLNKIIMKQQRLITTIEHYLNKVIKDIAITQSKSYLEAKIKLLNEQLNQFRLNDQEIWDLAGETVPESYNTEMYFQVDEKLQEVIIHLTEELRSLMSSSINTQQVTSTSQNIKLPEIILPTFDGSYAKWVSFKELFLQLVDNQNIPDVQKMYHLSGHIKGEPWNLIKHLISSGQNYQSAWEILCNRYDNKRVQVTTLLNQFLSQPSSQPDSFSSIKNLHDTTKECLMGLQNLKINTESWDPILVHLLMKKFDKTTHTLFEQNLQNPRELSSMAEVLQFLERRFQSLEILGNRTTREQNKQFTHSNRGYSSLQVTTTAQKQKCVACNNQHALFACKIFLNKNIVDRQKLVKQHNLCFNCLQEGHTATSCSLRSCTKCNQKHNTLLHGEIKSKSNNQQQDLFNKGRKNSGKNVGSLNNQVLLSQLPSTSEQQEPSTSEQVISLSTHVTYRDRGYVLLGTVKIKLRTFDNKEVVCRAILDSGSQMNFITKRLANILKIKGKQDAAKVKGIGEYTVSTQGRVSLQLNSLTNDFTQRVDAYILPQISKCQPTMSFNVSSWNIPKTIELADPDFYQSQEVDILIGTEIYYHILCNGQISLGDGLPVLQNTVFGWMVAGKINNIQTDQDLMCGVGVCDLESDEVKATTLLQKFFEIEEIGGSKSSMTVAEKKCEDFFNQTLDQDKNGRFIVRLPFAMSSNNLGNSKDLAIARLCSMERKFKKDSAFKKAYVECMREYIKLGHMTEIKIGQIRKPYYVIPHHAVLKPESTSTKLRVVFDASAPTSTGASLNSILHTGPKSQTDLFSVLIRFRLFRYVFTADIKQMYRQILVHSDDRKYQIIVWRENENEPIRYFVLNTVTFGISSAPYLAIKCLHHLAYQQKLKFPLAAQSILEEMYVDDAMGGANTLTEALEKQNQLDMLLKSSGFELRKWCANHKKLLENISVENQASTLQLHDDKELFIKTLGMIWLPKSDEFHITSTEFNTEKKLTKRRILSDIARLFDPLGIMSPVIVVAKLFMKQLWALNLSWDDPVPALLQQQWTSYRTSLQTLSLIKIPRHIASSKEVKQMQLHIFCDASEQAYGCAAYIRSELYDGTIIVRLLCAKSKVAPSKNITLPRLELCAAYMGAEFLQRIKTDLHWQKQYYCWSDSSVVLAWINSSSSSYHTFVANRISTIQTLTLAQQWKHVPSKENPADIISRGISPEKLKDCNLWFYGPLFLHGSETNWPQQSIKWETNKEKRNSKETFTGLVTSSSYIIDEINHRNSFTFLQRVVAYILRYKRTLKERIFNNKSTTRFSKLNMNAENKIKPLSLIEIEEAANVIVKKIQQQEFSEEISTIQRTNGVKTTSALASLSPFLDKNNIIRVGGRLQASSISYDSKHPIVLPYKNEISKLILKHYHITNLHVGPQALLSAIRQKYWPIKGKTLARSVVKSCHECTRNNPQFFKQYMGNLPKHRVQPARPFINTGVDFCGPFHTHFKIRGKKPVKTYVAIFCCFATKAVHIEVVSDLTTEAFIAALKRFIARRGHCRTLYCDNATNFLGANNQLQELQNAIFSTKSEEIITKFCGVKGIDFKFIPPRAPHFGGLWEAAVKSAKGLFYKSVKSSSLTYEELETVMIEIEAILNSRPLTPLSDDPNDFEALTPGHFLIGEPLNTMVDPHAEPRKGNLLYRWKAVAHLKKEFWQRWTKEYLSQLQHRYKWNKQPVTIKPDTMVIVKEDNMPILSWPLGRILQAIEGPDGIVRVADVKTANGIIRRPIHRLAPLPAEPESSTTTVVLERNDDSNNGEGQGPAKPKKHARDHPPNKRKSDRTSDTRPSKVKKQPSKCMQLMLLLFNQLLLPMISQADVKIKQFTTPPGLYFEDMGNTRLITDEWNLVVYFDLTAYWKELQFIFENTKYLNDLCLKLKDTQYCNETIHQFNKVNEKLKTANQLLTPRKRYRRSPFNFIGNIANSLFGVLDSSYAEDMANKFINVKERDEHILALIKNQTSLIDSTTNIIAKSSLAVERQLKGFGHQINMTMNAINNLEERMQDQQKIEMFNSLSTTLILITANYQRIQNALLDIIIDTHHGNISPILLAPKQLQEQLNIIKEHLPSNVHLIDYNNNLLNLYKLMTIEYRISSENIIFRLKLPLISSERFQLFNVIAVPTLVNGTFLTIEPSTKYLLVDMHREMYYAISYEELMQCKSMEARIHYCVQHHPLHRSNNIAPSCELSIMTQTAMPATCQISTTSSVPRYTQLNEPNVWIYAVSTSVQINVWCNQVITQYYLNGTGILNITDGCSISDETTILKGLKIYTTETRSNIIPTRNFIEFLHPIHLEKLVYQSGPDLNITNEINQIKTKIQNIRSQEQLPNNQDTQSLHHLSISYTCVLCIIAIALYLIISNKVKNRQENKPTPAPINTHQIFTIDPSLVLNSAAVQSGAGCLTTEQPNSSN